MGRRGGREGSWRLNLCSCSSESSSGITAVSHAQIHTAWNTHRQMRPQRTCGKGTEMLYTCLHVAKHVAGLKPEGSRWRKALKVWRKLYLLLFLASYLKETFQIFQHNPPPPHICPCLTHPNTLKEMTAVIRSKQRPDKLRLHLEDFAPETSQFYLPPPLFFPLLLLQLNLYKRLLRKYYNQLFILLKQKAEGEGDCRL